MTPSRHMPPRVSAADAPAFAPVFAPGLVFGFVVLGVLTLGRAWLHSPLLGAGLTFILFVAFWETRRDTRLRDEFLKTRAREATAQDICRFARNFDRRTVDPWVIRAVYEELADDFSTPEGRFAPRAEDHLFRDLRLDPDDLDLDMAPGIAKRIGRSLDLCEENPFEGKVETVADLVLFLNGQPRTGPVGLSSR